MSAEQRLEITWTAYQSWQASSWMFLLTTVCSITAYTYRRYCRPRRKHNRLSRAKSDPDINLTERIRHVDPARRTEFVTRKTETRTVILRAAFRGWHKEISVKATSYARPPYETHSALAVGKPRTAGKQKKCVKARPDTHVPPADIDGPVEQWLVTVATDMRGRSNTIKTHRKKLTLLCQQRRNVLTLLLPFLEWSRHTSESRNSCLLYTSPSPRDS